MYRFYRQAGFLRANYLKYTGKVTESVWIPDLGAYFYLQSLTMSASGIRLGLPLRMLKKSACIVTAWTHVPRAIC